MHVTTINAYTLIWSFLIANSSFPSLILDPLIQWQENDRFLLFWNCALIANQNGQTYLLCWWSSLSGPFVDEDFINMSNMLSSESSDTSSSSMYFLRDTNSSIKVREKLRNVKFSDFASKLWICLSMTSALIWANWIPWNITLGGQALVYKLVR